MFLDRKHLVDLVFGRRCTTADKRATARLPCLSALP